MNIASWIILIIIIAVVFFIVRGMVKDAKAGNSPTCGGDCKHCGGYCHQMQQFTGKKAD